jgi:hypothetical protein
MRVLLRSERFFSFFGARLRRMACAQRLHGYKKNSSVISSLLAFPLNSPWQFAVEATHCKLLTAHCKLLPYRHNPIIAPIKVNETML